MSWLSPRSPEVSKELQRSLPQPSLPAGEMNKISTSWKLAWLRHCLEVRGTRRGQSLAQPGCLAQGKVSFNIFFFDISYILNFFHVEKGHREEEEPRCPSGDEERFERRHCQ